MSCACCGPRGTGRAQQGCKLPCDRAAIAVCLAGGFHCLRRRTAVLIPLAFATYACAAGIMSQPPRINMQAAREEAQLVLFNTVAEVLKATGTKPQAVDILVVNCSLFNPTPSLSGACVLREACVCLAYVSIWQSHCSTFALPARSATAVPLTCPWRPATTQP